MPSYALLLCAMAAVLGTLAVTQLGPDLRLCVDAGLASFAALFAFERLGSARFRALVALALVAAAANAAFRERDAPNAFTGRTARYDATIVELVDAGDGSAALTLALDGGSRVLARVRGSSPSAG